jgi:hypothetical protein
MLPAKHEFRLKRCLKTVLALDGHQTISHVLGKKLGMELKREEGSLDQQHLIRGVLRSSLLMSVTT